MINASGPYNCTRSELAENISLVFWWITSWSQQAKLNASICISSTQSHPSQGAVPLKLKFSAVDELRANVLWCLSLPSLCPYTVLAEFTWCGEWKPPLDTKFDQSLPFSEDICLLPARFHTSIYRVMIFPLAGWAAAHMVTYENNALLHIISGTDLPSNHFFPPRAQSDVPNIDSPHHSHPITASFVVELLQMCKKRNLLLQELFSEGIMVLLKLNPWMDFNITKWHWNLVIIGKCNN